LNGQTPHQDGTSKINVNLDFLTSKILN
jgi:hypothetical protein